MCFDKMCISCYKIYVVCSKVKFITNITKVMLFPHHQCGNNKNQSDISLQFLLFSHQQYGNNKNKCGDIISHIECTNVTGIHTFYFYNNKHIFITTNTTFTTKHTYFFKINTGPQQDLCVTLGDNIHMCGINITFTEFIFVFMNLYCKDLLIQYVSYDHFNTQMYAVKSTFKFDCLDWQGLGEKGWLPMAFTILPLLLTFFFIKNINLDIKFN